MRSWQEVLVERMSQLYDANIQKASVGVLILLIVLTVYIIRYMMDPEVVRKRRDREVRKAVAAREALKARRAEQQESDQA